MFKKIKNSFFGKKNSPSKDKKSSDKKKFNKKCKLSKIGSFGIKDKILTANFAGCNDKYLLQSKNKVHIIFQNSKHHMVKQTEFPIEVCNNK